jgi:DNA-binding GntR family transcriptional regulator
MDLATTALNKPDIEEIAERITAAVMEHRLPPGIKLAEEKLASAFGVSRTKIRQALTMLSREGLVRLHPNRGAFVTSPTVQEAIDLLATRRLVEPEIVRNVIARSSKADIKRLRAHIAAEDAARQRGDRREFHMLLAQLGGNTFIEKLMAELCPLTCLIIALYDAPQTPACPENEHILIVDAIESKNEKEAVQLMISHLDHVRSELRLGEGEKQDIDWDQMFG